MDRKFLDEWSVKLNVPKDRLESEFEKAIQEMTSHFPKQEAEVIFEKAKLKLKVDYKRTFMSSAKTFVGVVVGNEESRDKFSHIRDDQIAIYMKAKENAAKTGDQSMVQNILDKKIVRLEGTNPKIIPIWPRLKVNGEPSKVAGQDMPSVEDSLTQMVYVIGTEINSKDAKGYILELNGKACNQDLHKGEIVNFRALDRTEKGDEVFKLSTNQTTFMPAENEYLKEGLEKLGITGLITKFFSKHIAEWSEINEWVKNKNEHPTDEAVPERFKNLIIIPNSLCIHQNFNPDNKQRIKINICGSSDDVDDETVLCLANKSLDANIDFAQNSKVVAIGRPWLPAPRDNGSANLLLFTSGMFAYPDWKIPRVDAEKLSERELMQRAPVQKEQVQAEVQQSEPVQKIEPQQAFSGVQGAEQPEENKQIEKPKEENHAANDPWD